MQMQLQQLGLSFPLVWSPLVADQGVAGGHLIDMAVAVVSCATFGFEEAADSISKQKNFHFIFLLTLVVELACCLCWRIALNDIVRHSKFQSPLCNVYCVSGSVVTPVVGMLLQLLQSVTLCFSCYIHATN